VRMTVGGTVREIPIDYGGELKANIDPKTPVTDSWWVVLYQRAYIKALSIDVSGWDPKVNRFTDPRVALETLWTGSPFKAMLVADLNSETFSALQERLLKKREDVAVAFTKRETAEKFENAPYLISEHAYTVIGVEKGTDEAWFVNLRNPWGADISLSSLTRVKGATPAKWQFNDGTTYSDNANNDPTDGMIKVPYGDFRRYLRGLP